MGETYNAVLACDPAELDGVVVGDVVQVESDAFGVVSVCEDTGLIVISVDTDPNTQAFLAKQFAS